MFPGLLTRHPLCYIGVAANQNLHHLRLAQRYCHENCLGDILFYAEARVQVSHIVRLEDLLKLFHVNLLLLENLPKWVWSFHFLIASLVQLLDRLGLCFIGDLCLFGLVLPAKKHGGRPNQVGRLAKQKRTLCSHRACEVATAFVLALLRVDQETHGAWCACSQGVSFGRVLSRAERITMYGDPPANWLLRSRVWRLPTVGSTQCAVRHAGYGHRAAGRLFGSKAHAFRLLRHRRRRIFSNGQLWQRRHLQLPCRRRPKFGFWWGLRWWHRCHWRCSSMLGLLCWRAIEV
mmetsp:Transcript_38442/g.68984  ORF Transcript_38442/g.68984 Transcript_38442/m.68984 type:complete len:290 (-) Transcript_38442:240-1109(-)